MVDRDVDALDTEESLLAGESEAMRAVWHARKAALIEEGLTDLRAGRVVTFEAVSAWIDSLGTEHERRRPEPDQQVNAAAPDRARERP